MQSSDERIRYNSSHWSREEDKRKALDQYLRLGERAFNKTKFELFVSMIGEVSGKRILDYGGGAGIMAIPLAKAGADAVLVDAEANALRTARFYARRDGVEQRIRMLQSETFPAALKGERFDIILAKDVIEHIQDDQQFLSDLFDCQSRGGILLLSTQNRRSLNYLLEGSYQKYWLVNADWCGWDSTHLRSYTAASLRQKLENAGYTVKRWSGVFIVSYSILSWFSLLKVEIDIPALRHIDLSIGRIFPFNRFGWNVIAKATWDGE
jgi:2-polyprenyl-6-hydroxyphenyl methylase/3-demethylubiquinone-9 3-methyltransferase